MSQSSERNLALFIDFDNVALGARDSRMRFDIRLLMQRVLEKGKVVVKRAYADWHHQQIAQRPGTNRCRYAGGHALCQHRHDFAGVSPE